MNFSALSFGTGSSSPAGKRPKATHSPVTPNKYDDSVSAYNEPYAQLAVFETNTFGNLPPGKVYELLAQGVLFRCTGESAGVQIAECKRSIKSFMQDFQINYNPGQFMKGDYLGQGSFNTVNEIDSSTLHSILTSNILNPDETECVTRFCKRSDGNGAMCAIRFSRYRLNLWSDPDIKWSDPEGIAQAILEIMCALWMANLGIGPPVYAAGIVGHTLDRSVLVCPKVDVPILASYNEVGVTQIFNRCDELGKCRVVHLDLKPQNVGFWNPSETYSPQYGSLDEVYLMDFGDPKLFVFTSLPASICSFLSKLCFSVHFFSSEAPTDAVGQIQYLLQRHYKNLQDGTDRTRFAEICRDLNRRKASTASMHNGIDLVFQFNKMVEHYMPIDIRFPWTGGFDGFKKFFLEPIKADGLHPVRHTRIFDFSDSDSQT